MAETGGPTTQSGIFYQNTIAARYLGALLDLRTPSLAGASRVTSVRVEAPAHVDDIVVTFADGHTLFIQAKEALTASGEAWDKFWASAASQISQGSTPADEVQLVIGKISRPLQDLREALERMHGKNNLQEWKQSLSKDQARQALAVFRAIGKGDDTGYSVAKRVRLDFVPLAEMEVSGIREWMPKSTAEPAALFSILRDLCGGHARTRRTFRAGDLSETLLREKAVRVFGTQGDDLERYRAAIAKSLDHIAVPGTGIGAPEADLFVLPDIYAVERTATLDFDDETSQTPTRGKRELVDIQQFPSADLQLLVLESGAGHGKSTILRATARRIASSTSYAVALFHAEWASQRVSLLDYLNEDYNGSYGLQIDWTALCEQGRAVLVVDGIDELEDDARSRLVEKIGKAAALYPLVAFLVGARDSSIAQLPPNFKLLRVSGLRRRQMVEMLTRYMQQRGGGGQRDIVAHVLSHPELEQLCVVPLLLSIFAATLPRKGRVATNRSELLEHYILHALAPERHKGTQRSTLSKAQLREGAALVAELALRKQQSALSDSNVRTLLAANPKTGGDVCLDALVQHGILQRRKSTVSFALPTIQEYLAGCSMADSGEIRSIDLLHRIYERSWAQSIQFAVERLNDADDLLRNQLEHTDDVFHTSMRFVARCIVNGAVVKAELKDQVAERLIAAWERSPYETSRRIGQLIIDGFCVPLRPSLRQRLQAPDFDRFEGPAILQRVNDPALSSACLKSLLGQPDIRDLWRHEWVELLAPIVADAVSLLVVRARLPMEVYSHKVIADVFYRLRSAAVDWRAVADDSTLPPVVRAAAEFGTPGGPVSAKLIEQALGASGDERSLWHGFVEAYIGTPWWREHLRTVCRKKATALSGPTTFDAILGADEDVTGTVMEELEKIAHDPATHATFQFRIASMLGGHAIGNFAQLATERLATIDSALIWHWLHEVPYLADGFALAGIAIIRRRRLPRALKVQYIRHLASQTMYVPSEPRRSLRGMGPFHNRPLPNSAAAAVASWAEDLIRSSHKSSQEYLDLVLICAELKSVRWLDTLSEIIEQYLDCHSEVADDDWNWFAGALMALEMHEKSGKMICRRIWEIVEKAHLQPIGSTLDWVLENSTEIETQQLLDYLSAGKSRDARRSIITHFERMSERQGLRLDVVDGKYLLTNVREPNSAVRFATYL